MKLEEYVSKYGNKEVDEKMLNDLLNIEENKIWKPKTGENYFTIITDGGISIARWYDTSVNEELYLIGNCFQTKEQAEFVAHQRRFLTFMAREFDKHKIKDVTVNDYQSKYCLTYWVDGGVNVDHWTKLVAANMRFVTANKAFLCKFAEQYKNDIKKYYFEIKE